MTWSTIFDKVVPASKTSCNIFKRCMRACTQGVGQLGTLELEGHRFVIYKLCDWSRSWRRSSSLRTRPSRSDGSKKFEWDEKSILTSDMAGEWIMFHRLLDFALGLPKSVGSKANTRGCDNQ